MCACVLRMFIPLTRMHTDKQMKASEWNTNFSRNNDDNRLLFIVVVEALAVCLCLLMTFCNRIVAVCAYAKAIPNDISTVIHRWFASINEIDTQMYAAPNIVK